MFELTACGAKRCSSKFVKLNITISIILLNPSRGFGVLGFWGLGFRV